MRRLRPAIVWAIFVLVVCLMPASSVPGMGFFSRFHLDKLIHVFLYGGLSFLLVKGFTSADGRIGNGTIAFAVLATIGYGGAIELLQEIPILRRSAELGDLVADIAGAILGAVIVRWGAGRNVDE